ENDEVRLNDPLATTQLATLPAYEHGSLSREKERDLVGRYGAFGAAATAGVLSGTKPVRDADFYGQPHFDDAGLRRRRDAGTEASRANAADEESRYITRSEEELAIGREQRQAGEVDVRKSVETERVSRT